MTTWRRSRPKCLDVRLLIEYSSTLRDAERCQISAFRNTIPYISGLSFWVLGVRFPVYAGKLADFVLNSGRSTPQSSPFTDCLDVKLRNITKFNDF
jgi:hypothetical protein